MRRLTLLLALALVAPLTAWAASPIPQTTPYGVMMVQAMRTLGAWEVPCSRLPGDLAAGNGQVTCAQVPGSMYGFFRDAVHGRLYEYLARKTLTLEHGWWNAGGRLTVAYRVDGGTFTVRRERANGLLYAVFRFQPAARAAAPAPGSTTTTTASAAASAP